MIRIQLKCSHITSSFSCKISLNRKNIDFFLDIRKTPHNTMWQRCKTFLNSHFILQTNIPNKPVDFYPLNVLVVSLILSLYFISNFSWFEFFVLWTLPSKYVMSGIWKYVIFGVIKFDGFFFCCTYNFGFYLYIFFKEEGKSDHFWYIPQFTPSMWVFPFYGVFPYV